MVLTITPSGETVPQTEHDAAVARNTTLNGLVNDLRTIDPTMAKQIEGVSAVGAQSNWMLIATPVVSFISVKYFAGGLDPATQNLLAGLCAAGMTTLVGLIWRNFFTVAPVTSVLPRPADAPPDVSQPAPKTP